MSENVSQLVEGLRRVMEEQREEFKKSLAMKNRQQEALKSGDSSQMTALTNEESALGRRLSELEGERKSVWNRIAAATGRPESELNWDNLSVELSTEQAQAFSALLDELGEMLQKLVSLGRVNEHLLRRGLERTEFIVRAAGGTGPGTYGPDGEKPEKGPGTRVDRQA